MKLLFTPTSLRQYLFHLTKSVQLQRLWPNANMYVVISGRDQTTPLAAVAHTRGRQTAHKICSEFVFSSVITGTTWYINRRRYVHVRPVCEKNRFMGTD